MALNIIPDADGDGTINIGPGWIAGAYSEDGGTVIVSDPEHQILSGASPQFFQRRDWPG
jgi:hypothetical protein